MNRRIFLASTVGTAVPGLVGALPARAQSAASPFIRWADLEVDAAQLETFRAATRIHGEAVLRDEPGVIAFHAVAEAEHPSRVRVFEMYDNADAYLAHVKQPHFRAFVAATEKMVTRRRLHDVAPVRLGAKRALSAAPLVRIAHLDIDPAQLPAYKAAVAEEIDDSIRLEPGVLTIYSVALADRPEQLRFFEIYADDAAYRRHLDSAHFRKYVETTKSMITARTLFETQPLFLGLRPR